MKLSITKVVECKNPAFSQNLNRMKNTPHLRTKNLELKNLQDIPCQAIIARPRFLNPKISKTNLMIPKTSKALKLVSLNYKRLESKN